ncbi:MAG: V-type ATP synthase subunit E family protein [Candidatus Omnitrophica bacterium]|nr:V-type ATP synthase subunit E family protein [Candidatus Omnitrophota bacterium]
MSLESILAHILSEAQATADKIIQQANLEAEKIRQKTQEEIDAFYQQNIEREKALCAQEKLKSIVLTRLEAKKNLLRAKQKLIDVVFSQAKAQLLKDQIKKEQITKESRRQMDADIDFYLKQLRQDYVGAISKILFNEDKDINTKLCL